MVGIEKQHCIQKINLQLTYPKENTMRSLKNVRINSMKREFGAELLLSLTLVTRLVQTGIINQLIQLYRPHMYYGHGIEWEITALTKDILERRWVCGLESAKQTLKVNTQFGIKKLIHPYEK